MTPSSKSAPAPTSAKLEKPALRAGDLQTMDVCDSSSTCALDPLKTHATPAENPIPLMVTRCPPSSGPLVGKTEAMLNDGIN